MIRVSLVGNYLQMMIDGWLQLLWAYFMTCELSFDCFLFSEKNAKIHESTMKLTFSREFYPSRLIKRW